jgi:hypothetical protein
MTVPACGSEAREANEILGSVVIGCGALPLDVKSERDSNSPIAYGTQAAYRKAQRLQRPP